MKCANAFCIYWEKEDCWLADVSLDALGRCTDCILADIPPETLDRARRRLRDKYEAEDI